MLLVTQGDLSRITCRWGDCSALEQIAPHGLLTGRRSASGGAGAPASPVALSMPTRSPPSLRRSALESRAPADAARCCVADCRDMYRARSTEEGTRLVSAPAQTLRVEF